MNELQIDAVLGCIAEIEHSAKNTSGAASIVMADLAAHMRQVIAPFDPESKLTHRRSADAIRQQFSGWAVSDGR